MIRLGLRVRAEDAESPSPGWSRCSPRVRGARRSATHVEFVVYGERLSRTTVRALSPASSPCRARRWRAGWETAWHAHPGAGHGRRGHDPAAVAAGRRAGHRPGRRRSGSPSHPTTRLCLELLQELPRTPLADWGCGCGVLAVAARTWASRRSRRSSSTRPRSRRPRANGVGRARRRRDGGARRGARRSSPTSRCRCSTRRGGGRRPPEPLIASGFLAAAGAEWRRRAASSATRRELDGWAATVLEPA